MSSKLLLDYITNTISATAKEIRWKLIKNKTLWTFLINLLSGLCPCYIKRLLSLLQLRLMVSKRQLQSANRGNRLWWPADMKRVKTRLRAIDDEMPVLKVYKALRFFFRNNTIETLLSPHSEINQRREDMFIDQVSNSTKSPKENDEENWMLV